MSQRNYSKNGKRLTICVKRQLIGTHARAIDWAHPDPTRTPIPRGRKSATTGDRLSTSCGVVERPDHHCGGALLNYRLDEMSALDDIATSKKRDKIEKKVSKKWGTLTSPSLAPFDYSHTDHQCSASSCASDLVLSLLS